MSGQLLDHYIIEFLSTSELIELLARDNDDSKICETKNQVILLRGDLKYSFKAGHGKDMPVWNKDNCSDHLSVTVESRTSGLKHEHEVPLWFMKLNTVDLVMALKNLMCEMENMVSSSRYGITFLQWPTSQSARSLVSA